MTDTPNGPKIGISVSNFDDSTLRRVRQLGITNVHSSGGAGSSNSNFGRENQLPWTDETLGADVKALAAHGIKLGIKMITGFPNAIYGRPGRDEDIEKVIESVKCAGRLGIPVVEYNWYAHRIIEGYSYVEGRGGSEYHAFDYESIKDLPPLPEEGAHTADAMWDNITYFLKAVIPAAEEAGVKRVVVASSDSTIGLNHNPPDWGPQYLPVDEAHPLRPIEAYSLSKHVTESICRSFVDRGALEVQVIRPSHIVFPPEYPELRQRGDDVENYHVWCYVAPEDVASGFVLALEREDAPFDTFILVADDGLNVRPTLEMLDERLGHIPKLAKPEKYDRLSTASILDNDHARDMLGWRPKITWRDMLKAPD